VSQYSNQELLEGVRTRNAAVLNFIYRNFFPHVEQYVSHGGGTPEDARDVFQESLIIMFRFMQQNPPPEVKDFNGYLFGVCKNVFLKFREKRKPNIPLPGEYNYEVIPPPDSVEFDSNFKYALFQKHFLALDEDSRLVLKMFYEGSSLKEIAEKMGYKDEGYAKRKKYLCQKMLIERIKEDPEYREL
jgi:RNA polymerase sigma factor (sigma-70 family)